MRVEKRRSDGNVECKNEGWPRSLSAGRMALLDFRIEKFKLSLEKCNPS